MDLYINQYFFQIPYREIKDSPLPGCSGAVVASAEKYEETELADISGVKDTDGVLAVVAAGVLEGKDGELSV
jgi:hypothetical protein